MKPEELAEIRSESGLTPGEFAKLLNEVTGMNYRSTSITAWEKGRKNIPSYVVDAAYDLANKKPPASEENLDEKSTEDIQREIDELTRQFPDSPPTVEQPIFSIPTSLEAACTEMFQGIGMMVELAGQVTGQPKVVTVFVPNASGKEDQVKISLLEYDGKLIQADAFKLGKAWAKLAEKNEWVARILKSLTGGGAWVEALAATSGTMVKIYQNHMGYAAYVTARENENNGTIPAESTEESGATI